MADISKSCPISAKSSEIGNDDGSLLNVAVLLPPKLEFADAALAME